MTNKSRRYIYDYNIYKIPIEKKDEFIEHLQSRKFEVIPLKTDKIRNAEGFSFALLFCDKENLSGSPWMNLLSSCSLQDLGQSLKIYGAVFISFNETICFVVSYGNAHFYMNAYCDFNFGLLVAERLIDLDTVKAQQNKSYSRRINRTFYDYFIGASLTYRSGEVPSYIEGTSISSEDWGVSIKCGTSAQFMWEETPLEIGKKLSSLEKAINSPVDKSLPRLLVLNAERDKERIDSLFSELAVAIRDYSSDTDQDGLVSIPSFYMLGTKVIQNDIIGFKLTYKHKGKYYTGGLNMAAIKSFLDQYGFNIETCIQDINIVIEYGTDTWTPRKPLIEYIEFITKGNFCLRQGKWCVFNDSYKQRIFLEINRINFSNHLDDAFTFRRSDLIAYAKTAGIFEDIETPPYETYFNHSFAKIIGGICVHPSTVPIEGAENKRYKYEICDVYSNNTMYFIKIGKTSDFAYAVDQALLTLDQIELNNHVQLPSREIVNVNMFCLLLIFSERKTLVETWEDIYSINFLIHLTELKMRLSQQSIDLHVDFSYEKNT